MSIMAFGMRFDAWTCWSDLVQRCTYAALVDSSSGARLEFSMRSFEALRARGGVIFL